MTRTGNLIYTISLVHVYSKHIEYFTEASYSVLQRRCTVYLISGPWTGAWPEVSFYSVCHNTEHWLQLVRRKLLLTKWPYTVVIPVIETGRRAQVRPNLFIIGTIEAKVGTADQAQVKLRLHCIAHCFFKSSTTVQYMNVGLIQYLCTYCEGILLTKTGISLTHSTPALKRSSHFQLNISQFTYIKWYS